MGDKSIRKEDKKKKKPKKDVVAKPISSSVKKED